MRGVSERKLGGGKGYRETYMKGTGETERDFNE